MVVVGEGCCCTTAVVRTLARRMSVLVQSMANKAVPTVHREVVVVVYHRWDPSS